MNMDSIGFLQYQDNGFDYTHYHTWAGNAIMNMVKNRLVDSQIEEVLRCLMDTYNSSAGNYEYGWTTAMDAPTVGVAMILAYEITGDEKYELFLNQLIPFLLKEASDGGYIININDKRWLLEYASKDITEDNAMMVLNGSMFGTCGTAYIAAYTRNEELKELVQEQISLYQDKMPLYKNNDRNWYYYMLNPLTINQSVKLYIENNSFISLAKLMETDFYNETIENDTIEWLLSEEADRCKTYGSLKTMYAVQTEEDMLTYSWCRYAAPHPYMIDLKNVEIEFYNGADEKILTVNEKLPDDIHGYGVYTGTVSSEAKYVKYFTGSGLRRVQIGKSQIVLLTLEQTEIPPVIDWDYSVDDDLTISNDFLFLDSDTSDALWGSVWCSIVSPSKLVSNQYYTIEIENFSNITIGAGITIYDSKGISAFRYLPQILPGKNLQVFSIAGLLENGGVLENISKFQLRFYTNAEDIHNINISLEDMRCFENTVSLHRYISTTKYKINQQ